MTTKSRSRLRIWLAVILLVLLAVCGVGAYLVWNAITKVGDALSTDTRVSVRPQTANGRLELDLTYGREVTGIATVTVFDEAGEMLWEISGQSIGKPAKIMYGQVPTEPGVVWKQEFPAGGKPPADIRGKTVRVQVNNRFQVAFGPGHELTEVIVEVPK